MNLLVGGRVHRPSTEAWQRHLGRLKPIPAVPLRRTLTAGTLAAAAERTLTARAGTELLTIDAEVATGSDLLAASSVVAGALGTVTRKAPGRRVLLCMPSSLDFATSYLGVLRAGYSAILANPALTKSELERLVAAGSAMAGIVSPEVAETLDVSASARPLGRTSLLVTFDATPGGGRVGESRPPVSSDEALLAHTSGSTGEPKGVPLSHASLLASMRAAMASWRWSAEDVVVHSLPLYHQHGLGSIHALFLGGGRTFIKSHFDPEELTAAISTAQATIILGVPAVYRRLIDAAPRREAFRSLRLVVSGSAPLPPGLFDELAGLFAIPPLERYGMTESGLDISNLYEGPRKGGSVGFPLPGLEAVIGTPDCDAEAEPGTDGEILLRGPHIFGGYLGPEGKAAFTPDGWLRTGDIGRVDPEDGSISITGRSKDVIISGGLNVYPREVEVVLERHPAVAAVAVGGLASEQWGEAVSAIVVARPGDPPRREELVALCRQYLAAYKHPKQFILVKELPRNDMGKVLRTALALLAETGEALN